MTSGDIALAERGREHDRIVLKCASIADRDNARAAPSPVIIG